MEEATYPITIYDEALEFRESALLFDMLAVLGDLSHELHTVAVLLDEFLEGCGFYKCVSRV